MIGKVSLSRKSGYVVAMVGNSIVYEGYLIEGNLFILKSPRYDMRWYDGLLSEEEYNDHIMGNPLEYAHKRYGDKFLSHVERFTEEVLNRVERELDRESIRYVLKELPEDHVRVILGLLQEERRTPDPIDDVIKRVKGKVMLEEDYAAVRKLMEISPKDDFIGAFVYPNFLLLLGRYKNRGFAVLTSHVNAVVEVLREWEGNVEEEETPNMDVEHFLFTGVPLARIYKESPNRVHFSIFRRVGRFIKPKSEITLDFATLKKAIGEYRTWVSYVERELLKTVPPGITLPAWRKMVMAYLNEYPNPEDFVRKLTVETGMSFPIPKLQFA